MANLATIELDKQWLRRVRGKLDVAELARAKDLADQDVKQFIRELYGSEGEDENLETILDDAGDITDVATVIITDLYHEEPAGTLDRITGEFYGRFKDLADLIASYYCLQWGDFMGEGERSDDNPQERAVGSNLARKKTEIESIGYIITSEDSDLNPSTQFHFRNSVMLKNRIVFRRKTRR